MSYRGVIRNGVVVLQPGVKLAEGTELVVSTVDETNAPTLGELFKDVAGKGTNLPRDGATQHDHYIYGTPKR